jgi:hypothetical protein
MPVPPRMAVAQAGQANRKWGGQLMLDAIFIAATAAFFAVGVFYVRGCERLKQE